MSPRIRFGLIVGGVALVVTTCVSFVFGFCGPFVALLAALAGAAVGYLMSGSQPATSQPPPSAWAGSGAVTSARSHPRLSVHSCRAKADPPLGCHELTE